jgi:hypothetical protein
VAAAILNWCDRMQLGICCSPLQRQLAVRLTSRLARNLGITTVIVADEYAPLIESWEQASASYAVLLMLDGRSAPGPVKRDDWQSLLAHNGAPSVAILKLEHCFYPKLLERSRFFAPDGDELEAERWVERWLVSLTSTGEIPRILRADSSGGSASPAEWWTTVVDTPGVLALTPSDIGAVQTFACEAGSHFQGVVWIGCEEVPAEALTSEIEFRCAAVDSGRLLFVLVHTEPDMAISQACTGRPRHSFVIVEGRLEEAIVATSSGHSIEAWIGACRQSGFPGALLDLMLGEERRHEWEGLVTPLTVNRRWFRPLSGMAPNREACQAHLEALQESFRGWRRRPELCLELVGEAAWAIQRNRLASGELCLDLALFLLAEKRVGEAVTWLRILAATADEQDEFAIQAREELGWLVDEFGSYRRPRPIVPGEQVCFDFPGFVIAQDPAMDLAFDNDRLLLEELRANASEQPHGAASASPRSGGRQLQFDLFA